MHGAPKKLRTDLGGENVDAWRHMIQLHGRDEKCIITGSSVHNERIKRLWRDAHRSVLMPHKELFTRLEMEELLDVTNEVDVYCLHEIFLDRINHCLSEYKDLEQPFIIYRALPITQSAFCRELL